MAASAITSSTTAPARPVRERVKRRRAATQGDGAWRGAATAAAARGGATSCSDGAAMAVVCLSAVADARVERGVADVDHEVDGDDGDGDPEHGPLDHGVVARV